MMKRMSLRLEHLYFTTNTRYEPKPCTAEPLLGHHPLRPSRKGFADGGGLVMTTDMHLSNLLPTEISDSVRISSVRAFL